MLSSWSFIVMDFAVPMRLKDPSPATTTISSISFLCGEKADSQMEIKPRTRVEVWPCRAFFLRLGSSVQTLLHFTMMWQSFTLTTIRDCCTSVAVLWGIWCIVYGCVAVSASFQGHLNFIPRLRVSFPGLPRFISKPPNLILTVYFNPISRPC